jgi:hypothetical protein
MDRSRLCLLNLNQSIPRSSVGRYKDHFLLTQLLAVHSHPSNRRFGKSRFPTVSEKTVRSRRDQSVVIKVDN